MTPKKKTIRIKHQQEGLVEKINLLERQYRSMAPEQRDLDFVADFLRQYIVNRESIDELFKIGEEKRRLLRSQRPFLSEVNEDYCRRMDEFVEEYGSAYHKMSILDREYISKAYQNAVRYQSLSRKAGLPDVSADLAKKHEGYASFEALVKADFEQFPESVPTDIIYSGEIHIPNLFGTDAPYGLTILTNEKGEVYWKPTPSVDFNASQDRVWKYEKSLKILTKKDIFMILAASYLVINSRRNPRQIVDKENLDEVARGIGRVLAATSPNLGIEVYSQIRAYRDTNSR